MKNIFISILLFGFCYSLGFVSKSVLVQDAILYVFLIMWITFIPAALAKTEKFYDLAGSLTYMESPLLFILPLMDLHFLQAY